MKKLRGRKSSDKTKKFMDKIAKGTDPRGEKHHVCGEVIQNVMIIRPYRTKDGAWRYEREMASFCKCNEKEVFADKPVIL